MRIDRLAAIVKEKYRASYTCRQAHLRQAGELERVGHSLHKNSLNEVFQMRTNVLKGVALAFDHQTYQVWKMLLTKYQIRAGCVRVKLFIHIFLFFVLCKAKKCEREIRKMFFLPFGAPGIFAGVSVKEQEGLELQCVEGLELQCLWSIRKWCNACRAQKSCASAFSQFRTQLLEPMPNHWMMGLGLSNISMQNTFLNFWCSFVPAVETHGDCFSHMECWILECEYISGQAMQKQFWCWAISNEAINAREMSTQNWIINKFQWKHCYCCHNEGLRNNDLPHMLSQNSERHVNGLEKLCSKIHFCIWIPIETSQHWIICQKKRCQNLCDVNGLSLKIPSFLR